MRKTDEFRLCDDAVVGHHPFRERCPKEAEEEEEEKRKGGSRRKKRKDGMAPDDRIDD